MKAIRDYIEIMFQGLPKTKKVNEIKSNITDTMESKYEDLIAEGKSEQEAVGIVIGQFGSIDELKVEFGINVDENVEYIENDDVENYLRFKKKMGMFVGIGIILILLGAEFIVLFSKTKYENIVLYGFLMLVTVAVLIFVMIGLESTKYEEIDSAKYQLDSDGIVKYNNEFEKFRPNFNMAMALGVVLCIFGGTSPILMEDILGLHENAFAFVLFPCVAIAVYLFIFFGVLHEAYRVLIMPEKIRKEKEIEENDYGWLFGVTMPLAAMFYLFIGFYYNVWHPGWLVFPIVAVVTTGVMITLNNTKRNNP